MLVFYGSLLALIIIRYRILMQLIYIFFLWRKKEKYSKRKKIIIVQSNTNDV